MQKAVPCEGHGQDQVTELFDGSGAPDVTRIVHDGAVCAEDTCVGDVHQAHVVPLLLVAVQLLQIVLGTAVILEVRHDHVRVRVAQVAGDFAEVFAVPALLEEVQHGHSGVVAADKGVRVVAHALQRVDLGGQHAEDDLVLVAGGIGDLNIRAVQRAQRDRAVQHELHVAGAGSLGAGQRDLLGNLGGRHQALRQADAVVLKVDDAQLATHGGILVDQLAQLADHADHLLGHVVAGGGLRAEDVGLGGELGVGVVLQVQVLGRDVQGVQVLALVLVHALDLAVEDGIRVDDLTGGLLQIVGEQDLVLALDLGGSSLHGLVVHELLQLLQLSSVGLEAVADGLLQQAGQAGVGGQQPAAVGNAVGDILERLRLVQEVIMEDAVLDDLAVQLGNAVDGVAGVGADIGGADLIVADDRHVVDLALIAGEGLGQIGAAAAIHLADDLPDAGQGVAEDVRIPLLQRLAHDGVVGVGEHLAADVEGGVPLIAALVQQDAHHLGDGNGRVGVVQLDGNLVSQIVQRAVLVQMVLQNVGDGGSREEILLAQTQDLALGVVVVGVEDLGDQLCGGRMADGRVVVAGVEAAHIKAGGLGLPQTQLGNAVGAVTGHIHVVGHGDDRVVVLVLYMVEAALPRLDGLTVKADLLCLIGVALDPNLTAGQPVVGSLLLPAVHDLLLEDAVLIQDGVAGAGDAVGGHAVQIAGGQTAQTAVA